MRKLYFALAIFASVLMSCKDSSVQEEFTSIWPENIQRTWIGPEFWANRLQDWQIDNGRLECLETDSTKPMRTVHLLTHRLVDKKADIQMEVVTGAINENANIAQDAATGFLIGAGPELDYKAAALIHHSLGPGGGVFAGINAEGKIFIKDFEDNSTLKIQESTRKMPTEVKLILSIIYENDSYTLSISAKDYTTGENLAEIQIANIDKKHLIGNVALVSHPGTGENTSGFWFKGWSVKGDKFEVNNEHNAGPVLCSQYTLSNDVLKLTAQMMPLGKEDNTSVSLEIKNGNRWEEVASTQIVVSAYTAPFRIEDWNSKEDIAYRVKYLLKTNSNDKPYYWYGTIRKDPIDKDTIVVAGFTGCHQISRNGADCGEYVWDFSHVWFPHNDLTENVAKHAPDVLFFSGDQIYEWASPTAMDNDNIYTDYLYRWYLWCWAFGDLARDIPCICIPDDHDVLQGNLWGEGGRHTEKDDKGGYVYPADFVNMVQATQTSHLPDAYDPTPIDQNISVYYSNMNYGRISFAVLEDRKFKSGPNGKVPATSSKRADHVIDENWNTMFADVPGLKLLGDRQLKFLNEWAADWQGVDMKVALSQTVFANMATHHGPSLSFLVADYDANGWPQTGRNKALDALRKGHAFMYAGDQHLATLVQHGIDEYGDAGWSFCVPSIANFYPRAWMPKKDPVEKFNTKQKYCGKYMDGFGNKVNLWAHTNPSYKTGKEPAELHDKMPGYGIVKFNKNDFTITIENWPRYAEPGVDAQYEGWPMTINSADNYGRKAVAYLPEIVVEGMKDPVVQVINERTNIVEYTIRIKGNSWKAKVFDDGSYTIKVGEPGTDKMKTVANIKSVADGSNEKIQVKID